METPYMIAFLIIALVIVAAIVGISFGALDTAGAVATNCEGPRETAMGRLADLPLGEIGHQC